MKIGLVPMAAKPYHAGHDLLVRLASQENDKVIVFASTGDRDIISGKSMLTVWKRYLMPAMPHNVEVRHVEVPVSWVYKTLEEADDCCSDDLFRIYSDDRDIAKYKINSLTKAAAGLCRKDHIILRGISRSTTCDISATQLRRAITADEPAKFIDMLPRFAQRDGEEIFRILKKE